MLHPHRLALTRVGRTARPLSAWREHRAVIIVRDDELAQQALTAGTLTCPHAGCGGSVYRDGRARLRRVRTREGGERELRPQRVACRRCDRVNVLLPAWSVPGRGDDAETIGTALVAAALGGGHRSIAKRLGRPATTVRGWLRAARRNAEALWTHAGVVQYVIEQETDWSRPAGSPLGDAMTALAAAATAARRFFGADRYDTSLWEFIVLVGGGRLLRPPRQASG